MKDRLAEMKEKKKQRGTIHRAPTSGRNKRQEKDGLDESSPYTER